MNTELRNIIAVKGDSIAGLAGGLWYMEASAPTKYPYAVFSFVTQTDSRDSANTFEDYLLQINIYDKSGTNIEALKESFEDEFSDSESDPAWIMQHCKLNSITKQFARPMKVDKVFQITLQFRVELTKL